MKINAEFNSIEEMLKFTEKMNEMQKAMEYSDHLRSKNTELEKELNRIQQLSEEQQAKKKTINTELHEIQSPKKRGRKPKENSKNPEENQNHLKPNREKYRPNEFQHNEEGNIICHYCKKPITHFRREETGEQYLTRNMIFDNARFDLLLPFHIRCKLKWDMHHDPLILQAKRDQLRIDQAIGSTTETTSREFVPGA